MERVEIEGQYCYKARLSNLRADETYSYRLCNRKNGAHSEVFNFTTAKQLSLIHISKYVSVLRKDSFFDLVYPGEEQITPAIKDYIEKDLSKFEKALYSYD